MQVSTIIDMAKQIPYLLYNNKQTNNQFYMIKYINLAYYQSCIVILQ